MTLPELFEESVATYPRGVALTSWSPRMERNISSEALAGQVRRLAAGLIALGLKKGDRVLLLSENRPEWPLIDYATMFAGGILVPVYTSLTVPQLAYILENSGSTIAIASTQPLLDRLLAASRDARSLRQILVIEEAAAAQDVMHVASAAAMGDDLLARSPGAWKEPATRIREDDVATIIYTSGTTGPPKGVMLSHRNLVTDIVSLCDRLDFQPTDVALSFLPLCHVTQRIADYCYFRRGVRVVYVSLDDLGQALTAVRPTTFPGVPRVFEKARDAILARIAKRPAPVRALFRWAHGVGREMGEHRIAGTRPDGWLRLRHALADRLVLRKVRDGLGGRLRLVVCGGAPLNPAVMRFFLACGVPILEGYGLTETTVLTINLRDRFRPGTVGPPLPCVELRLAEDGEVLAKGPIVGRGYYLDVQRTEAAFSDGWFHTGDLGRFDEQGHLMITGRKKELLVTSGGKKISPALIEQQILSDNMVSQVALVGDGRKYVCALVVPDRQRLLSWCREHGLARNGDAAWPALLDRPEVRGLYEKIIEQSNGLLARFEQIKKFALLPAEFTVDGGELTPTLKLKRRVIEEKYREVIESLYAESRES